ncbi:Acyl-protein thioesterase 1 [Lamellibrachia satsuma]|nr:Acyl-protein thioesterase 1 [Lamellibrachia satsuma]
MGASTSQNMTQPYIVKATAKHTASVIFLHGLGDSGLGWSQSFGAIRQPHVKYIFPNAQVIPVTLNAGFRMPSWFDIKGLDPESEEDEQGIKKAGEHLQQVIQDEVKKGIPRSRIVVGGFSQGGATALFSCLAIPQEPVAGIVALSSWLPLHKRFPEILKSNQATPVLQAHGKDDFTVPYAFGLMTSKLLEQINPNCDFKSYPNMAHSSCEQEMQDVSDFVRRCLPTN